MEFSVLVTPFLGALQASFAVLLTIFYGVLAAQFDLLGGDAAKQVSRLCVRMLLPALLIQKVGSELHADTGMRYVPILFWAVVTNLMSVGIGMTGTKLLRLPSWATTAIAFNNTTSLPLLLIKSLEATGILDSLLKNSDDTASAAVGRATSYFLVNALVNKCMTFALGPKLLEGDEDASGDEDNKPVNGHPGGDRYPIIQREDEENVAAGNPEENEDFIDEQSSLLPGRLVHRSNQVALTTTRGARKQWDRLPSWLQDTLAFAYSFVNAPLIGAVVGAIIGLTPALHRLFFNPSNEGGYFNAWLTSSIKNIGDLFASLQILVVGVKLSKSLRNMKKGEESGHVPLGAFSFITVVRFLIWPMISIPFIWLLATKTSILADDPILWFSMMLMPTGPPAMILTALADVNGSPEAEKMAVTKLLTLSYAITPLTCLAVVGSLKASEAAIKA